MIRTAHWAKPLPTAAFDWSAWIDGEEESGPVGQGATEREAVADLQEQLSDIGRWPHPIDGETQ